MATLEQLKNKIIDKAMEHLDKSEDCIVPDAMKDYCICLEILERCLKVESHIKQSKPTE